MLWSHFNLWKIKNVTFPDSIQALLLRNSGADNSNQNIVAGRSNVPKPSRKVQKAVKIEIMLSIIIEMKQINVKLIKYWLRQILENIHFVLKAQTTLLHEVRNQIITRLGNHKLF